MEGSERGTNSMVNKTWGHWWGHADQNETALSLYCIDPWPHCQIVWHHSRCTHLAAAWDYSAACDYMGSHLHCRWQVQLQSSKWESHFASTFMQNGCKISVLCGGVSALRLMLQLMSYGIQIKSTDQREQPLFSVTLSFVHCNCANFSKLMQ